MRITNIKTYQIEGKLKEPFGGEMAEMIKVCKYCKELRPTKELMDGRRLGGINEFKDILEFSNWPRPI